MADAVRVLIIAPAPLSDDWAGGISNFVRSFVANMPDDFSVSIAGVAGADDDSARAWRTQTLAGREVRFLPVARLAHGSRGVAPVKVRAMLGLVRVRRHLPAHGVVVQVHAPAMDIPLLLRRTPIIRVVHNAPDNLAQHSSGTSWRHSARALRRFEQASFHRAAHVFFVDRATYERYAASDAAEHADAAADAAADTHMSYLPNGVDTAEFAPLPPAQRVSTRAELAAKLDVPAGGPWLLFCGRLDRQKDPDLLIATFAAARRLPGTQDAQLIVVGSGPLEEVTRQAARSAGVAEATHFVGTVDHDQLSTMMAVADVLLLTSVYEGAPFVVLEALACGLPVVATAVGDVPVLVEHEHTGWISGDRNALELARGVAWAVAQPRDVIAPRAAAAMRRYRIQDVLAPFYEAHRELSDVIRSTISPT